jgi:hypothetical protein
MELFAAVPDLNHEAHDRIPVGIRHSLGRADRIALNQGSDDLLAAGERTAVHNCCSKSTVCSMIDKPSLVN